ncbi:MAG TPA: glycosyltransferase [Sandaracinaceae bacterium]
MQSERRDPSRYGVLYISMDGLLEPLGHSQIVEPLLRLANRGWRYTVVSLEKSDDVADGARVASLKRRLRHVGIEWRFARYRTGGAQSVLQNLAMLVGRALAAGPPRLIHARSHLPSAVAALVSKASGAPYIFDFRGYWIEERLLEERWIRPGRPYAIAKRIEAEIMSRAAGAVTLTDLARDDLLEGRFGSWGTKPASTITTCADYERFRRNGPTDAIPADLRSRLDGKLVVGYVGSINRSYLVHESLGLFARIRQLHPEAHLLCLTRQTTPMWQAIETAGIPPDAVTVTTADHGNIDQWLRLCDWGLLLLTTHASKRGSMPTKLGEFFAAGVRPIHYGCNEEVGRWVAAAGTGITLPDCSQASLDQAAHEVVNRPRDESAIARGVEITRPHFALDSAVDKYDELYRQLLSQRMRGCKVRPGSAPAR